LKKGFGSQTAMLNWVNVLDAVAAFADFPSAQSLVTRYVPLLVFAVLLAASLIKAVRVWQEIHDVEEADTPSDLLAAFQQAHAEGELDDAEFARVRDQLAGSSFAPGPVKSGSLPCDQGMSDRIGPLESDDLESRSPPQD
jgi:hypothetical protein